MKICFIAPGEISVPPLSWGALETVVWYQGTELKKLGFDTYIINEKDSNLTYQKVMELKPDVVHLHYGSHYEIMPHFPCRKIITCHDGSFKNSIALHDSLVRRFFYDCEFFCLTNFEKEFLIKTGISTSKIRILPNGVDTKLFKVNLSTEWDTPSICLGKIDVRKRQSQLQYRGLNVDFVGKIATLDFDAKDPAYKGEWSREQVYENLTNYSNLILLSESELQPLVCLEALSAGLGLVISEACIENLDLEQQFISVIPNDKLNNIDFINKTLINNKKACYLNKKLIREYAQNFDWKQITLKYKEYINE